MSEWKPIETAPHDGTFILLFCTQMKHHEVKMGGKLVVSGYWDAIDQAWCSHGSTWEGPFYEADQWMPLPAPPGQSTITPALDAAIQDEIEHGPKDIMK